MDSLLVKTEPDLTAGIDHSSEVFTDPAIAVPATAAGPNGDVSVAVAATGYPPRPTVQLSAETEAEIEKLENELKYFGETCPSSRIIMEREIARIKSGEMSPEGFFIIHKEEPVKIVRKVYIPIKDHPDINFVGRILGVKGQTLKALQQQTRARILVYGRGSMRDQAKEEELRVSGDPRYTHLKEDLHVYVEIHAYPVEAEGRFANVVAELKRFLDPTISNPLPGALGLGPRMSAPPMRGGAHYPRPPYGGGGYRPRGPPPPPSRYQQPYVDPNGAYAQAYPPAGQVTGYPPSGGYQAPSAYAPSQPSYAPAPQPVAPGYPPIPPQAQYASWSEAAPGTNGQEAQQAVYAAPSQAWGPPPAKMARLAPQYAAAPGYNG